MNDLTCYILVCAISFLNVIPKGSTQDFGYDGTEGPNFWGEKYHQCVGKHQSPINIQEHDVEIVNLLPMKYEKFDEECFLSVVNNGHTVQFKLNSTPMPTITGGPLIGKYQFAQLHFHWGENDDEGSENQINNSSYPMELHMVFYSSSYGSVENATEHPDGLAVLSFLFSRSDEMNENYTNIIKILPKVIKVGATAEMEDPVSLENLITLEWSSYFTYGGSLTTPPCSEVVTWIEYKHTVPLAHEQMQAFRELNSINGKLIHNFRPTQPLHGRVIRMNRDVSYYPGDIQRNTSTTITFNILILIINALLFVRTNKM